MLSTDVKGRVYELRKLNKYTQDQMGDILNISKTAYGKKENGRSEFSLSAINAISEHFGATLEWLLRGTGAKPVAILREVEHTYSSGTYYTEKMASNRFSDILVRFKLDKGIDTNRQASELLHINETHLSNVINGRKSITLAMLTNALRYGQFNINYVLAGVGGYYTEGEKNTRE